MTGIFRLLGYTAVLYIFARGLILCAFQLAYWALAHGWSGNFLFFWTIKRKQDDDE